VKPAKKVKKKEPEQMTDEERAELQRKREEANVQREKE
jgi:hypothetical protein